MVVSSKTNPITSVMRSYIRSQKSKMQNPSKNVTINSDLVLTDYRGLQKNMHMDVLWVRSSSATYVCGSHF